MSLQKAPAVSAVPIYLTQIRTGLGGGLGRLLAEPILKAMQESTEAGKNLSEARRVLEMVVPLAYRPPLKVCDSDIALPSAWCPWQGCFLNLSRPSCWRHVVWSHRLDVVNCQLHETSVRRSP